jgi:hypothetical protein
VRASRARKGTVKDRFSVYTAPLMQRHSVGTMGRLTDLLQLAQERGRELGLPYAGALTPQEA